MNTIPIASLITAFHKYLPNMLFTRQGDKTSSTIFDLFIDELSVRLRENCGSGIFITNDIPDIFCLMFADDVAGCAETAIKLQQQIHIIDSFCCDTVNSTVPGQ